LEVPEMSEFDQEEREILDAYESGKTKHAKNAAQNQFALSNPMDYI
jgi:hypothetical protein